MNTPIQSTTGLLSSPSGRTLLRGLFSLALACPLSVLASTNTLKNIAFNTLPDGAVELHLNFANSSVPSPRIFTTENPDRIAIDLPDTDNAAARHTAIGQGSVSGVSSVSANGRTRVVVEAMGKSSYQSRVQGAALILTVDAPSSHPDPMAKAAASPIRALPVSPLSPAITDIDFRRGPQGEGRVLINFNSPGANVQLHHSGDQVTLDINGVRLPANQASRLDTLDFATPVKSITTRAGQGGGAHVDISVKGQVAASSSQVGNQYVVEITSVKAAAAPAAVAITRPSQDANYAGKRVTFNFQDIPVRSALQLIADISGLNLVASDSVAGSVTLHLVNVPWDQALDVILRSKSLDKRRSGNVIWVAPQAELAKYEQDIADAKAKEQDTAALVSEYIPISYGKAADIAKLLTTGSLQGTQSSGTGTQSAAHGFLSSRGSVAFDVRTNTLLLNDTPANIKQLKELIAVLDKPVQQVLIESRIVIATDDFTRDLGVKWGVQTNHTTSNGTVISTAPTGAGAAGLAVEHANNNSGSAGATGVTTFQTGAGGFNVNLPVLAPAGSMGLAILGKNYMVDLELSAAQTEGRSEVISSPRVITANQQQAVIRQGQEIGYVTYQNSGGQGAGSGTATVQFKDAVLELKVTPTITSDNRVYLAINVKKDALAGYVDAPGSGKIPTIDTREINTSVLVANGQTVVLGGIYEVNKSNSVTKVPGLGNIPGIGALFRSTSRSASKAELLIFVTPRILDQNNE